MDKKTWKSEVTVHGEGFFPRDMLRYDTCDFASEDDKFVAETSVKNRMVRVVQFATTRARASNWTPARWLSFGWVITIGPNTERIS